MARGSGARWRQPWRRRARGAQRRRVDTVARDEQWGELEQACDELLEIEPAELELAQKARATERDRQTDSQRERQTERERKSQRQRERERREYNWGEGACVTDATRGTPIGRECLNKQVPIRKLG